MSVSCRLEHGLGARSSGVSWVRSPSSVVRSHQLREAGGDDRAGSREGRPRAPSQRFITEHLNRAWHGVPYRHSRVRSYRERQAHDRGRTWPPARLRLCPATHPPTNVTARSRLSSTPSSKSTSRGFSSGSRPKESHPPHFVRDEFEAYLKCGRLEYGLLRVKCDACRHEKLVAFSCKRRGFCPSCGARRMAESRRRAGSQSTSRFNFDSNDIKSASPTSFRLAAEGQSSHAPIGPEIHRLDGGVGGPSTMRTNRQAVPHYARAGM